MHKFIEAEIRIEGTNEFETLACILHDELEDEFIIEFKDGVEHVSKQDVQNLVARPKQRYYNERTGVLVWPNK